jgi:hypothetical protein
MIFVGRKYIYYDSVDSYDYNERLSYLQSASEKS